MKLIIDSAIPFIKGVLEPYAEVVYCAGSEINCRLMSDCDALIVRTRTRCDEALLANSRVKFIATATIGTDHIDLAWCRANGISVASAAGCNARGVLQWVAAALKEICTEDNRRPEEYSVGVVGVGNVGSLVAKYAERWAFRVLKCDPPRQQREGGDFVDIDTILRECNIITLHTPLDATTEHLINEHNIDLIAPDATIINASRGAVVDNGAVLRSGLRYMFDVWEDEPNLDGDILAGATLSTPHIAGYSRQGKANATSMVVRALAHHFALPLTEWYPEGMTSCEARDISWEEMCRTIDHYFSIKEQTKELKSSPDKFEALRNNYTYREEYF